MFCEGIRALGLDVVFGYDDGDACHDNGRNESNFWLNIADCGTQTIQRSILHTATRIHCVSFSVRATRIDVEFHQSRDQVAAGVFEAKSTNKKINQRTFFRRNLKWN